MSLIRWGVLLALIAQGVAAMAATTNNVALGRPATQSSTNGSFIASLGVNGNLGDFTHTAAGVNTPATWEVNLTNTFAIEKIVIWNRSSCCGSRLRDVTVRITDLAGAATNYTSLLLNPENTLNSPPSLTLDLLALTGGPVGGGRVRITRTPDPDLSGTGGVGNNDEADVLSLAEVEVFAIPLTPALVASNSAWKYLATGAAPGATWTNAAFDDSAWSSGLAKLGYGDGDEATTISYGSDPLNKPITTYFRRVFTATNTASWSNLQMRLTYDDGALVYLNGAEVRRLNMPVGPIGPTTPALSELEPAPDVVLLPISHLREGVNVLAVEVHQASPSSPDLAFALQLSGVIPPLVVITNPVNGQTFQSPASLTLNTLATDADGSVLQVELLQNGASAGVLAAPYSSVLGPLYEGSYSFQAVATDTSGITVTSAPVSITVVDTNPPSVLGVVASGGMVTVTFTKPVANGATNAVSYSIDHGVGISGVVYGEASNVVVLATSALTQGSNYMLRLNGISDWAGRVIAPDTTVIFNLLNFNSQDVGGPVLSGKATLVSDGYDVTGAGADVFGTSDQFQFESRTYTNDFDVQVRVEGLDFADAWSKAGLMARESLRPASRFAAAFATPTISGCYFSHRNPEGGSVAMSGSHPATYPHTWLRLRRAGDVFTGYASSDGASWTALGSASIGMTNVIRVGMAVTSRVTNQLVTARFRDFGDNNGSGAAIAVALNREPLGPSSRRTPLAITEIMYDPRPIVGITNRAEFIEIFNSGSIDETLGGYRLSGAIDFVFPSNVILKAGAFLVVARDPQFIRSHYGIDNVLGPWTGTLPGSEGTLRLRSPAGDVLLEIDYRGDNPWPIAAAGAGHSLILARPSYGERSPAAWDASDRIGGSPGRVDPLGVEAIRAVVINEFLAHTEPAADFVELYNPGPGAAELSGAYLTDSATTNKFRIPDGTVLNAGSFVSYTDAQLGFGLSASGERLFLVNAEQTRVIDAVSFEAQARNVSFGRVPDGSSSLLALAEVTPGSANSRALRSVVVISEIMYNPISGNSDDEFLELHNRGSSGMSLAGWRLQDGISFTFPTNAFIPAGGYIVVARNWTNLLTRYAGQLTTANTFGNYDGSLANSGERIVLTRPEPTINTNGQGIAVTNLIQVVVNEVSYGEGGRWGIWADGGGSSLELMDLQSDNRLAANWADSDESNKSQWTTIEHTGSHGEVLADASIPANDHLHVYLLGVGECLVDELEVRSVAGGNVNLLGNNGFESGLSGWTLQGSHDQSTISTTAYAGSSALRLRAASRGDTGANRIRSAPFSSSLSSPATLRAKARWLRGWPELLLRVHGGSIEAAGRLAVPTNLGTPGAPNSRAVTNAGPAVYAVQHLPVLPQTNEPVLVTARVDDPNGIAAVEVRYRIDPSTTFSRLPMNDAGLSGDALAGDGVFTARIPAQPGGTLVAFYIEASDTNGGAALFPRDVFPSDSPRCFPSDSPSRECLVRWGEPQMPGTFATYHLWTSLSSSNRWHVRDHLNNAPMDGTFVYNNFRAVYNVGAMYSGSPFHRGQMTTGPAGVNRCDYIVQMPEDDKVLGSGDFNLSLPGNVNGTTTTHDLSAQAEQTSYLLFRALGVPNYHRRYVHLFVNGSQRSTVSSFNGNFIFEDAQQPNSEVLAQWFPEDPDGELIKIEDWFEFNDAATSFLNNDGDLTRREVVYNGVTNLNMAPYRFMWRKRSLGAGDSANDYTNFVRLLNVVSPTPVNSAPIDPVRFQSVADVEQWMREFACQRTVGNFDSYGYDRGKNTYMYRRGDGRYVMMPWDIDWTLGTGIGRGPTDPLFGSSDPRMVVAYSTPEIRRAYLRAFKELADGPLKAGQLDPVLDGKATAFALNNVTVSDSTLGGIKSYLAGRRAYILSQLAGLTNAFTVNAPASTSTTNLVPLTGSAPVDVKSIAVNGVVYDVVWSANYTTWTVYVPLQPGANQLVVEARDRLGRPVMGTAVTNSVTYTGSALDAETAVIFSEIGFNPLVEGAEYIELFNTSSNTSFNLAGWRINGIDYTFDEAKVLLPRTFLVLARDRHRFASVYGDSIAVYDDFIGSLQRDGERLTLLRPGPNGQEVIVDRVRYEGRAPWPVAGAGSSVQLIDANQENARVGNWGGSFVPRRTNDGWRFVSVSANFAVDARLLIYLDFAGSLVLDDIFLARGSVPEVGYNFINNGNFEAPLDTNVWRLGTNMTASSIVTDLVHSGTGALRLVQTSPGSSSVLTRNLVQTINPKPTNTEPVTLSFWYYATNSTATNLTVRFVGNLLLNRSSDIRIQVHEATNVVTPGAANFGATSLPEFPPLWINEVQPENLTGLADGAGERDPWIELYNPSTNVVSLEGLFLSTDYGSSTNWAFPAGSSIGPQQFKIVWCDAQPGQGSGTELHAGFRLPAMNGSVSVARWYEGKPQVLDFVDYNQIHPDRSYGSFPDGQPFDRLQFFQVTPGGTNNGASAPLTVFINEWMAGNAGTVADPADGGFEDWFELYNPGPNPVDLAGCYLTDNLLNKFQYQITTNGPHVVPPGGYLLVWADEEPNQNTAAGGVPRADLHVNFALRAAGEAIALFAPDGTQIDAVAFGQQTNDVSQGRYPDGSPSIKYMPGTASPRAANYLAGAPNNAPLLATIGNQTVYAGQALSFQALATDNDAGQFLTFSLDSGAPDGAMVSPTGLFSWTPIASGTYVATVRVTDSGVPPLSDSEAMTIEVLGRPRFSAAGRAGNALELTWETHVGQRYRVEYKDDLSAETWALLQEYSGTGSTLSITNSTTAPAQRFYRVRVVQ